MWWRAVGERFGRSGVPLLGVLSVLLGCAAPESRSGREPPTLRIGLHSGPITLDPHRHDEVVTRAILGHIYEGLVGFDAEMAVVPQLAERWDSPDDLTWRFTLRPGVRFHDGRVLGIRDVVASLERARRLPDGMGSSYLVAVTAITALDHQTLELRTARPYPILLNKLTTLEIVPADTGDAEIRAPVGTGPYRVAAYQPGELLRLEAFAPHWSGPPSYPLVELRFVTGSSARVDGLLGGALDLVHEVAAEDAPRLDVPGRARLVSRAGVQVVYLHMRADRPPFSDLRVRRAVSLALDRQAYVEQTLGGHGVAVGQLLTPNVFGYVPSIASPLRQLALARDLLADAGYPDGLDVDLLMRIGRPAGVLIEQLAAAGIRARPVVRPWTELYPQLTAGEVDFYLGGWSCLSGDASDLFDSVVHSAAAARGYGESNFNGYANPRIDALIEEAGATRAMARRQELFAAAMALVLEDLPLIAVAAPHSLYGLAPGVEWRPRLDARVVAAEARPAATRETSRPGAPR